MTPDPPVPDHPDREALRAFLLAEDEPGPAASVEAHLAAGCPLCLAAARRILAEIQGQDEGPGRERSRRRPEEPERLEEERVRRALDRALRHEALVEGERRLAPALRERLRALTPERQHEAIRRKRTFRFYSLADLLADEAREQAPVDVARALDAAQLAVAVARQLDPAAYPRGLVADTTARAWAALGNARRVRGELDAAERAFGRARSHLGLGARDPLERADVLSLLGSLRLDQLRLRGATEGLEEAAELYRAAGDRTGEGKVLMKLARVAAEAGDPESAVRLLERAEPLVDSASDRRLLLKARHARAARLTEAGRAWEAMALFRSLRRDFLRTMSPMEAQHLPWLAGRIYEGLDQLDQAAEAYDSVRRFFRENEHDFDFVVSTLDLVAVRLKQGRTRDVQRLAEQMLPVFASCDLPKEAMKALVYFQRAAVAERATAAAVHDLTAYLQRTRRNPDLPYRGEPS